MDKCCLPLQEVFSRGQLYKHSVQETVGFQAADALTQQ